MPRILIVHKDIDLRKAVSQVLLQKGFELVVAADGHQGMRELYRTHPDLVVAGQELSLIEGEEFCIRLRRASDIPLVVLGSRNAEQCLVRMLEMGADAFLAPPLSFDELLARLHALLRRVDGQQQSRWSQSSAWSSDKRIDWGTMSIILSPTEFILFTCLRCNRGRVVSQEELVAEVWGDKNVGKSCLRFHIHSLKEKLQKAWGGGSFKLVNRWGIGYYWLED